MTTLVKDYMTIDLVTAGPQTSLEHVARDMRDHEVGTVLVVGDGQLLGLVTDRDITVRAVAAGMDPTTTEVGDVATPAPVTLHPEQPLDQAYEVMERQAVRRLPVVEGGRPVGILSLGDLALHGADRAEGGSGRAGDVLSEVSAAEGPSSRQAARREGLPANTVTAGPIDELP